MGIYYSDHTDKSKYIGKTKFNQVNISPTASMGLDYKITSRINARFEPTFRYGILQIIDAPVTA
jgi:hypothetical protein